MIRLLEESEWDIVCGWDKDNERHSWFRASREPFDNSDMGKYVNVGIFEPDLCACISLDPDGECHISAKRRPESLVTSMQAIREWWLKQVGLDYLYAWTVKQNRVIRNVLKDVGFCETGIRLIRGKHRGKPLEWVQSILPNPYKSDKIF